MQKNCTYFDVDSEHDKHLSKAFRGVEIEGRSIRVNRDDEGNKRSRSTTYNKREKFKGKKGKSDFSKSKNKKKRY